MTDRFDLVGMTEPELQSVDGLVSPQRRLDVAFTVIMFRIDDVATVLHT